MSKNKNYKTRADLMEENTNLKKSMTKKSKKRTSQPMNVRRFDAAEGYSFLKDWGNSTSLLSLDEEIRYDIETLRTRSRDSSLNNPYARRYFKALTNETLGKASITIRSNARNANGKPDETANRIINDAYNVWSRHASVDGMSMRQTLRVVLATLSRDGEILIIKRRGKGFGPFMYQLQLLEADYLDEDYSDHATNGNIIRNSIEYDNIGRVIAYYIYTSNPKEQTRPGTTTQREKIRVLAKDIIHIYDKERAHQGRGFPWLSASLVDLEQLKEYQKTELVSARKGSLLSVFFTRPQNGELDNDLGDEYEDEDGDDQSTMDIELQPGMSMMLPDGYEPKSIDPNNPNGNFADFKKSILRSMAAGVGMAYHTISNDYSSGNYSSLRQAIMEERETYVDIQELLIERFIQPSFEDWLSVTLEYGFGGVHLPVMKLDKYAHPEWKARSWSFVDPTKEMNAIKAAIDYDIRSRTDIVDDFGRDFKDVMDEIAAEKQQMINLGITDGKDGDEEESET